RPAGSGTGPTRCSGGCSPPSRSACRSRWPVTWVAPATRRTDLRRRVVVMRGALLRYRIMAYVVEVLLVILMCVGVPMRYIWHDETVVTWTGMPHGWLYMVLLITAFDL